MSVSENDAAVVWMASRSGWLQLCFENASKRRPVSRRVAIAYREGVGLVRPVRRAVRRMSSGTDGDRLTAHVLDTAFHVGDHLRAGGMLQSDPPFLDLVPLLVAPDAYSTYRGS